MRQLKLVAGTAALLALTALALAGCSPPVPPEPPPRPVATALVAGPGAAPPAVYAGEVRARYENDLAFRIAGKIVARAVEVGSVVKRGQLIARLDPQDQQLQVEATRAQLASGEADLTLARAELERTRSLRAQNFISEAALDARQNAFNAAEARVRQIRAQLDVARNAASYATLTAERDGVITAVNVEPGQVVSAGQPIARIARTEEREVSINVPESRLAELRGATSLIVSLWTAPDKRYAAKVRELSPNADPTTRTFTARISIADADDNVRLGMTANVALPNRAGSPTLTVPLGALGDRDGKPVVWRVDESTQTVAPVPVEVAQYREDSVALASGSTGGLPSGSTGGSTGSSTSGLTAGDRIVVAGVHKLLPGQKVRIADAHGVLRAADAK